MRILKTLRPGQKGTKKLLSRYGRTLLRVRYRYDEETRERLKTVELVIQRSSPQRDADGPEARRLGGHGRDTGGRRVALRIGGQERDLQRRVKSAGGRWGGGRQIWILRRDAAERLELLPRVVGGGGGGKMSSQYATEAKHHHSHAAELSVRLWRGDDEEGR